jgi:hypothetical protein
MKWFSIFSLYLLTGAFKPTASAVSLINIGFALQQTPIYLIPRS